MKILSINTGSSSLKFTLFNMDDESVIAKGVFERIGIDKSNYTIKTKDLVVEQDVVLETHHDAVKILLEKLTDLGIIKSLDEINGIGHRIVQGKDKYTDSVIITDEVINDIELFKDFAPLHNPAHVLGIRAFKEVLPDTPMVAVFDTAFHQTIDKENYLYPVNLDWYKNYGIRKYGAHGTSHKYISLKYKELVNSDNYKIISCHIGNGGSISAIKDGKCIDTSMGFTPLAGIMMGTRSGDIDSSIIPYIMQKEGKNAAEIVDDLNKNSGLLGLCGYSDLRDVNEQCDLGNEDALAARNKYVRRIVDYISMYYVLLGGCDAIIFTGGVGENNIPIRRLICEKLSCLGVDIDLDKNNIQGELFKLSTKKSKVDIYVIPTNEELMIARDTLELIKE